MARARRDAGEIQSDLSQKLCRCELARAWVGRVESSMARRTRESQSSATERGKGESEYARGRDARCERRAEYSGDARTRARLVRQRSMRGESEAVQDKYTVESG